MKHEIIRGQIATGQLRFDFFPREGALSLPVFGGVVLGGHGSIVGNFSN